jgi:hypothetical protein
MLMPKIDTVEALEQYFHNADHNGDGKLDPQEMPLHIIRRVDRKQRDMEVTLEELTAAWKRRKDKIFAEPTLAELRALPKGPPMRPPGSPDHGALRNRVPPGKLPPGIVPPSKPSKR